MSSDSIITLLLPIALALVATSMAVFWVVRPLLMPHAPPPPPEDDRLAALQARKEATLTAIRDLTFDFNLGKLTQDDFARHDARLRRQAIILMQQIEQMAPAAEAEGMIDAPQDAIEAQIEAEIAQRREIVVANAQPT